MTTCRASSYGRDTGSEGGYFYTVVPPTKINADSWIISVSGFLENFRALMCALLSGDKCCLQAYWRGKCTVNGEGGNFSVHDENLQPLSSGDFWTIGIEKLLFLGGEGIFRDGGVEAVQKFVTRIIELRTMHSRRDLESNGIDRDELISSLRIYVLLILVSICFLD